jgi:hypothetical protein
MNAESTKGMENDFRLQRLRKISVMQVGNPTNISTEHFQDGHKATVIKTWLLRLYVGPENLQKRGNFIQ